MEHFAASQPKTVCKLFRVWVGEDVVCLTKYPREGQNARVKVFEEVFSLCALAVYDDVSEKKDGAPFEGPRKRSADFLRASNPNHDFRL